MKNSAFFGCSGEFVAGLCDEPAQMQSSAQIKLSVRAAVFIRSRVKLNANDRGRSAMDIFRVKDGKIVECRDIIQDIPKKSENDDTMF